MKVPGEGSIPSRIAFIGEGPGVEEDREGRPFVGKSGEVLWQFAWRYASINRSEVYVTNLSKYRLTDKKGKDRPPTPAEFSTMAPELRREIAKVDPLFIVTLGVHSTAAMLKQYIPMEIAHGIERTIWLAGKGRKVMPAYHPAAGLHQSRFLAHTALDLVQVGEMLRGVGKQPAVDEIPKPAYFEFEPKDASAAFFDGHRKPYKILAVDTEGGWRDPHSIQFCGLPGLAWLIRATNKKGLKAFQDFIDAYDPLLVFHYALADTPVMRALGLRFRWASIRDTMEDLYLLQTEPMGLKPACSRLVGMEMHSWEEIVGPVVEKVAAEYIEDAISLEIPEWQKGEGRKHSVQKRLQGLLKPPKEGTKNPKTITEKWADKKAFGTIRAAVEGLLDPMPRPSFKRILKETGRKYFDYACRDADGTRRLFEITANRVVDEGLVRVAKTDLEAMPLFDRMSQVGLYVDLDRVAELEQEVDALLAEALEVLEVITGIEGFNPNSGDQVAAYCAERCASDGILCLSKLTKKRLRASTDDDALKGIQLEDETIPLILDARHYNKLKTTYIPALYEFTDPVLRLMFPKWKLVETSTGRAACEDPNLLAMPVRTKIGRKIRSCFRGRKPNHRIGSCDLSQIELRTAAALSQDANMMRAFIEGKDFHADVAHQMFGIPPDKQDPEEHRKPIKNGNFAMLYLGTAKKLEEMYKAAGIKGWDEKRCQKFRDDWFGLYPGVQKFLGSKAEEVRRKGYVTTPGGRKRYLPAIALEGNRWPFRSLREEAIRQAGNTPIQGGAGEYLKRAAPRVNAALAEIRDMGFFAEPLLAIHDEYLVEFEEDAEDLVKEAMIAAMTYESPWMGVPIKASWASAYDWGGIKK